MSEAVSRKRNTSKLSHPYPVLVGCQDPAQKILINVAQFTIGRSPTASYGIPDVTISRNHCFLEYNNNQWMVQDVSSIGTFINGVRLEKNKSHIICDRDVIKLGFTDKFTYIFYENSDVYEENQSKRNKTYFEEEFSSDTLETLANAENNANASPDRHHHANNDIKQLAASVKKKAAERKEMQTQHMILKNECQGRLQDLDTRILKERERLKASGLEEKENKKNKEGNINLKALCKERNRVACEMKEQMVELQLKISKSEERETELLLKNKELCDLVETERKMFRERLEEEKKALLELGNEKSQMAEEKCLEEKSKKELEQKLLETEKLLKAKEETINEMSKEINENKEKFKSELGEIVESELQCGICNEILLRPVTLNCRHTFCRFCIIKWKERKLDCPMCRTPITAETQAVVIDSFVNKIVETLPVDMKQRRQELLTERDAEELLLAQANAPPVASTSTAQQNGRRRGRPTVNSRGGRGGRQGRQTVNSRAPTRNVDVEPIPISSESSSSDTDDNDSADLSTDSSSVEGDADEYYGGYGYCFRCGRRGHWVRGCPF